MYNSTISLSITSVTPEMAEEFLKANFIHNRKLQDLHVQFLANEMKLGRFLSTAEIHVMYRNGEPILVNGQHTCAAIIKYGKPVTVTVRKTVVKEPGQIAMTYAFGHDTGLKRQFGDAINAYDLAPEIGLTTQQVTLLAAAINYIKNGFTSSTSGGSGTRRIAPVDLMEDVRRWSAEAKIFLNTIQWSGRTGTREFARIARKRASFSIALVTLYYQPDKAIEFWQGIARPDNLMYSDPRFTARTKIEQSMSSRGTDYAVNPARLSRQLAACWNAYMRGGDLSKVYPRRETELIVISGTPYNGKQPKGFLSIKNEVPALIA